MTIQPKPAVSAVIVQDDKILLVKRGREPNKDLWSLPGGSIEPGETIDEALAREVEEETHLKVVPGDLAAIHEVIEMDGGELKFHYIILNKYAHVVSGDLRPDSDAAAARWVPLGEVADYPTTAGLVERLQSIGLIK